MALVSVGVDWGDGAKESVVVDSDDGSWEHTLGHEYAKEGTYTIVITGPGGGVATRKVVLELPKPEKAERAKPKRAAVES